jgi:acrylyl-CoA reductase (NADPH)
VTLAGISSATLPLDRRIEIWRKLSDEWRLEGLEELTTTIRLGEIEDYIKRILKGDIVGRTIVTIADDK